IMKGEAHKLSLGYYVIKNPNKKRLMENITFEEAREEEIDFFENESPWKDNYEFNERIGVKKLQSKLSDLLIKAIMHDLPIINKEIQRKLEETRKELEKIPEPLGKNPRVELIYLIGKCVTGINESLDDNAELWCFINTEFIKFKKGLRSSRPVFVVGKDSTRNIAKFDVLEKFTHDPNDPILEEGMEITEAQITNQINKLRGRSLPGTTPYSAIIKLIESSQGQWKNPSLDCLDRVYCIMVNLVEKIVDETFSRFPNSHAQVKLYTNKWLDNCKEKTVEHIDFMFELERDNNHPFTLDSSEMVGKKVKYLNELHQAVRNEMRQPTDTLEVIASVMAYFSIAFKRYADNISKTIIHSFIYGFTKHIEEKLVELFISGDNDYDIDELVREDYNISSRREELKIKEKHMREVLDSLVRFGLK
ncbi:7278_t:CDS:2, partial [Acaulospora morrowiae]